MSMSGRARIGSYYFTINPDTVQWGYSLNTSTKDTYGGRVVQILSCSIDELTIEGFFGSRRNKDKYAAMQEFEKWVISAMSWQERSGRSMVFSYPPRGWYAKVYIKGYPSVEYSKDMVAPRFRITLVVDEGMDSLVEASQMQELQRIIDGVRWSRDKYNDPYLDQNSWEQAFKQLETEFGQAGMYNLMEESVNSDVATTGSDGSAVIQFEDTPAATNTDVSRPNPDASEGTPFGLDDHNDGRPSVLLP